MIHGDGSHSLHPSDLQPENICEGLINAILVTHKDQRCHYRGGRSPARALYLLLDDADTLYYKT
jgi:hypothetical protein